MAMAKLRLSLIGTIAIVGVAAFLVLQEQWKLREENRLLRQQMEQLQVGNDHLSKLLAQANNAEKLPNEQTSELLRLRGEVANLRRQTNELARLQVENQRLHASLLASKAGTQTAQTLESLPKESWSLVGYADPESAFQSALWAMSQGDAKTFRASLAPGGGEFAEWADKSDTDLSTRIQREAEKVTAFKIMDQEAISDDTAILTVMAEGINEVGRFRLQRIGHDWKLAGPVKDGEAPDSK